MKKVLNVGIGGRTFVINEDAYQKLDSYIERFRQKTQMGYQTKEVIDDLELRIAELFTEALNARRYDVVSLSLVNEVISQLGMPDGSANDSEFYSNTSSNSNSYQGRASRKFYRDSDSKVIGGVCSGLALYFDIDIMLVRILFVVAFICGSLGFWVYVIFWIVAPLATTAAQKCEMRGLPITAENLRRFSGSK